VRVFQKPVNANLRFYKAIGGTDFLGDFVYVDGGFHYLDKQILLALSHSPPIRIKTGGTFQVPFLIDKVQFTRRVLNRILSRAPLYLTWSLGLMAPDQRTSLNSCGLPLTLSNSGVICPLPLMEIASESHLRSTYLFRSSRDLLAVISHLEPPRFEFSALESRTSNFQPRATVLKSLYYSWASSSAGRAHRSQR
jgi:hypothetical protein